MKSGRKVFPELFTDFRHIFFDVNLSVELL
jgi:hypothetical protein